MVDSDLPMTVMRMMKRLAVGAVVTILVAFVYWCGILLNWWSPLIRPRGVPCRAKYVFLWESAEWFDCHVDERRNVDVCRAWDVDGHLAASGDFRLEGENRAATRSELHPSRTGDTMDASGMCDEIYLFGPHSLIEGKKLIRVGPTPTQPPAR